MGRFVVAVSGASGVILAQKAIQALAELGHQIELVMSQYALYTATLELGKGYHTPQKFIAPLPEEIRGKVTIHSNSDVGCAIASGSYPVDGVLIIPCSMTSVAAIAAGLGDNVVRRTADVALKEKRPLIIVPREAPLSEIHLENLLKLARAGATIVPPIPAWYTQPQSLADIEDFIVGKALDALKIPHDLYPRWKTPTPTT